MTRLQTSDIDDHPSLRLISKSLESFDINKTLNNKKCRSHSFGVYTLASGAAQKIGAVKLDCYQLPDSKCRMSIYDKRMTVPGFFHEVTAQIDYEQEGSDSLCRPIRWKYTADIKNSAGIGLKNMRIEKNGFVKGNKVAIKNKKRIREFDINGSFTINWLLFDTVSGLAFDKSMRHKFTLLDHYDQIKEDQILYYNKSTKLNIAGEFIDLHAYDHLGNGIVPWVYWVNENGKLLFAVSGIEAYIAD